MSNGTLRVKIFDVAGTQRLPVSKPSATVGSAPHCDVVLNHPSVQGEHLRAWSEGGRIWVQDLGGGTGTTINGIRLPPLKPMLVRDLDVLKLAECPATLGFETNMVRAPVVQTVDLSEITATDIKVRLPEDDLESVARELAQTKLDLQMARLDRGGADESRAQAEELRDEVRRLKVDRQRLEDSLSQIQQEKKSSLQRLESELAELKLKGLRELKDQRHEDEQKLALWKSQITEQLTKKVRRLNEQKSKSWITRPLSKDMIFEWETDLGLIFRQAILNETAPAREETGTGITKVTGVTQATAVTQGVAKSKRKKANVDLHRWALVGTALLVFAALVTILSSYLNIGHRQIASQPPAPAATPAPQTQSPALNAPPARKTRGSQR